MGEAIPELNPDEAAPRKDVKEEFRWDGSRDTLANREERSAGVTPMLSDMDAKFSADPVRECA
jgi:hypothetical protein